MNWMFSVLSGRSASMYDAPVRSRVLTQPTSRKNGTWNADRIWVRMIQSVLTFRRISTGEQIQTAHQCTVQSLCNHYSLIMRLSKLFLSFMVEIVATALRTCFHVNNESNDCTAHLCHTRARTNSDLHQRGSLRLRRLFGYLRGGRRHLIRQTVLYGGWG